MTWPVRLECGWTSEWVFRGSGSSSNSPADRAGDASVDALGHLARLHGVAPADPRRRDAPRRAGSWVGRVRGGDFVLDPFDAYQAGLVTNPNVVVAGSIGAGKSTLVKMMVDRALRRGRRVVVVDPKGEYGALARAHGVRPLVVGRDGWCWPRALDERSDHDFVTTLLDQCEGVPAERRRALRPRSSLDRDGATTASASLGGVGVTAIPVPRRSPRGASARSPYSCDASRRATSRVSTTATGAPVGFDDPLVVLDVSRYLGDRVMIAWPP